MSGLCLNITSPVAQWITRPPSKPKATKAEDRGFDPHQGYFFVDHPRLLSDLFLFPPTPRFRVPLLLFHATEFSNLNLFA